MRSSGSWIDVSTVEGPIAVLTLGLYNMRCSTRSRSSYHDQEAP